MAKYLPHGTTVSFNAIQIGGLISVGIPSRSRGVAEVTDSNSAGDRSYIAGLREGDSCQIQFRHDPADAGQLALEANYLLDGSGAVKSCVITLPASAKSPQRTYTFSAFVTTAPSGDLGLVDDNVAVQSCTIKVAGPITIA